MPLLLQLRFASNIVFNPFSFNEVPAFLYTGLTFHLLLLRLLSPYQSAVSTAFQKLIKVAVFCYAPFLIFGITGLTLGFTAKNQYDASIATDLRAAAGAALLLLAIVLCVVSAGAAWKFCRVKDAVGADKADVIRRREGFLLVFGCGCLFIVKFACK